MQCSTALPLLGSGGFEPSKAEPTDLQSAPFDHSGNCPFLMLQEPRLSSLILTYNDVLWIKSQDIQYGFFK